MRTAFVNTLTDLSRHNKNILLLTGDLGFSVFEKYIETYPTQYINMGIAEANMTGVAAGLAMENKTPFIYSIIPFVTMRNFEQIRNDVCYQNLNVKIIGVGAGFSYGTYGYSHYGLEDIGILRTLPNMTIFSPADPVEAAFVTKEAIAIKGPVYIRLGKSGEPTLYGKKLNLSVGKLSVVKEGKEIALIATGDIVHRAVEVAKLFYKKKIDIKVISLHTIKPFNIAYFQSLILNTKAIFTLEEHSIIGGIGSLIADIVAENRIPVNFKKIGVLDCFTKVIGYQEYMRQANGLSEEQIFKTILLNLKKWKII